MKPKGVAAIGIPIWLLGVALGAQSQEGHEGHQVTDRRYETTVEDYLVPDVTLLNQERAEVALEKELSRDKPVMLYFIFATCTTICPVMSAGFSGLQRELGDESEQVQLISISIDPEHDSPEVMQDYLIRYGAGESWDFLTGTREDIDAVMEAFDAYVSNKMNHKPLVFLKAPGSSEWVRLDGLMGTSELIGEYRKLGGE